MNPVEPRVVDAEHDAVVVTVVATRGTQVCEACVGASSTAKCSCGHDDGTIRDPVAWALLARNAAGTAVAFASKLTLEAALLAAEGVANVGVNTTIGSAVGGVSGAVSGAVTGLFWTALSAVKLGLTTSVSVATYLAKQGVQLIQTPNGAAILSSSQEPGVAALQASEVRLLHMDESQYERTHSPRQAATADSTSADSQQPARALLAQPPRTASVGCQTDMVAWRPKDDNPDSYAQFLQVPKATLRMGDMQPLEDRTTVTTAPTGNQEEGQQRVQGVRDRAVVGVSQHQHVPGARATAPPLSSAGHGEAQHHPAMHHHHHHQHHHQQQQQQQQQPRQASRAASASSKALPSAPPLED